MLRLSLRRIRQVLSLWIVTTSLVFVFLLHTLPTQSSTDHQYPWQQNSAVLPVEEWPALTAWVEESSTDWQTRRPLTRRLSTQSLKRYIYPQVRKCSDIPNQWPVDHPRNLDEYFGPMVGTLRPLYPLRFEYASYCPVDADPFLPWIHDVIVAPGYVHFVAQNKRRCRTSPTFANTDLKNLEPQIALFQSVPVKRLSAAERQELLTLEEQQQPGIARYRLASLEEADPDSKETRFLCHFHKPQQLQGKDSQVVVGESFSVFPFNYEYDNFRKNKHPMLNRPKDKDDIRGAHNEQIWNSILLFSCPIPKSTKGPVLLDLVPIRTPPRETIQGYNPQLIDKSTFDPTREWSNQHVLPTVENSGRWANIPVCPVKQANGQEESNTQQEITKQHYLVGCTWASAVFQTRGQNAEWDTSTSHRLLEWLTYHLYIAKMDHIYVYDNTEAFLVDNTTSLQSVISLFPPDRVTRIPWKFRVCNNNPPAHRNSGERSSQYAAEASCRIRYGPTTEWMAFLDTDEYLIPQLPWKDLPTWLKSSVASGAIHPKTNILSFFQTRPFPNLQFLKPYAIEEDNNPTTGNHSCIAEAQCVTKSPSITYLQTYDCERTPLPKPDYGYRAKKQIFRPSFVLNHFVHYTTVTRHSQEALRDPSPAFVPPYPYERRVDEVKEAFMLHTKTMTPTATANWKRHCHYVTGDPSRCQVGIAWPVDEQDTKSSANRTQEGYLYNCYTHARVQDDLAGQLQALVNPLLEEWKLARESSITNET